MEVGTVSVQISGLYADIVCRCTLPDNKIYRLYTVCNGEKINIGVLVPEGSEFVLRKKLKRNLTMLMDLYELTMANGVFTSEMKDHITYFDMFFRRVPDKGGFAIAAGLEQVVEYIENLRFDEEDIEYLRSLKLFDEGFLAYLKDMRFTGDVYAVKEGTPVFPGEPILTVKAPLIQAQFAETALLNIINHHNI